MLEKLFRKKNIQKVNNDKGYYMIHENGITKTVGLPEKFGILNIDFKNENIVSDELAEEMIDYAVDYEKSDNFKFKSASVYVIDSYGGYTWYCVTKHNDEFVYRLIVPDENNKAPWTPGCNPKFKNQFTEQDREYNNDFKNNVVSSWI